MHLFTGFPGFIAGQLIRQLFRDNVTTHIYAIVLPINLQQAKKEAAAICESYPNCKIDLFEGDITLPDLGLFIQDIDHMIANVRVLWHLAAIYDLAVSREIAWKVNVHGTANVNEFAKRLMKLERYIYFSTAYVAGRRDGVLLESELKRPQAFKNHYEETKFEAELRVEDLKSEVPITILRPGIVCGHSKTGEICKFDGPYFFLNLIHTLRKSPVIPFVGSKTTTINVVPVDYIIQAAIYIAMSPQAEGKTLHLTDPNPHKVQDMYEVMVKEMTGKKPVGRLPLSLTKKCLANLSLRKRLGVEYETVDYLNWGATFDSREAQAILKDSGIACPDFLEILPTLIRYYEENKHRQELFIPVK